MPNVDPSLVISLISLAVALTGAVMSRRALRRSSYRTAADLVIDADRILLDHPDLRPFIYPRSFHPDGTPPPAEHQADYDRIMALAETYLDILEAIWDHRNEYTAADRMSWREWIHDLWESSPTVRSIYDKDPGWYPTLKSVFDWEDCSKPADHPHTATMPGPTGVGYRF